MKAWDDGRAPSEGPLAECVHGSRLIGSDPALVLHGGGNTSVKHGFTDITGRVIDALYVKGSGWDLATIEIEGFAALPLDRLRELVALDELSDEDMVRELSAARLDPAAPQPSVEALLHALLPHRAVLHSHADVIVTLTNTPGGGQLVRDLYGDRVVVVPYVMPGFDLARAAAQLWSEQAHGGTTGMVLLDHGLFTFADTTREAYQRHADLIDLAERWLDEHAPPAAPSDERLPSVDPVGLAGLRQRISEVAGRPMIVSRHAGPAVARFVGRPDLADVACRGPLTPDHVIRTKRLPMVGTDVDAYAEAYRSEFEAHRHRGRGDLRMLDPAPRVVLDRSLGMLAVGPTAGAARIAADIYEHTMPVIERAEDHLGGYVALDPADLFDVEYWELEQAKLRRAGPAPELAGSVAIVTGAASGIGRACAAALLARGAAVAGLDLDPDVGDAFGGEAWHGITVDLTDADAQAAAVAGVVERYGGVDIVVAAAGIFGGSAPIAALTAEAWRAVQAVNVDAVALLLAAVHPLLARSPVGGRVVLIGSKNVAAPGRGAAGYSASKAALTQLGRVAALEWASDGIRVNVVHPDGVFDTGLWTDELLTERAANAGLSVEEYRTRNLLGVEVTSATVAAAVAALCSDAFAATTGAQVPIDGGNERTV